MASDSASAAAPGPNTPQPGTTGTANTDSPTPTEGGLTGLLAAVEPARFSLNPGQVGDSPTAAGTGEMAGVSSSDYHAQNAQEGAHTSLATGANGKAPQSIWRAWMLAGAERWRKGADARNKDLDIKKARAQALQIKESRSVNRSEKVVSGATNSGTSTQNNAGKSLNSKTSNANKGPGTSKNNAGSKNGPAGRNGHGSGGHGTSGNGGGAGRGGAGHHGGSSNGKQPHSKDPAKPSKTDNGKPTTGGSGRTDGKGSNGGSSPNGKSSKDGAAGAKGSTGKDSKPGKDTTGTGTGNSTKPQAADPKTGSQTGKTDLDKKQTGTKDEKKPNKDGAKTAPAPAKPGPAAPPGVLGKGIPWKAERPTNTGTANGQSGPRKLNVQESREAGYRDGTRAGTVAAHVGAWRDGVRDGWTDRKHDAAREKARLDQAHAARKQPAPAPQQKVPPMPSHAPTSQHGPQPIQVTGVTKDGVTLGQGADRTSLGHGEVRSLKQFERKLAAKEDTLGRIAEGTRSLKAHAEQQLKHVAWLTEQARVVEGGDQLLSALLKLEEAAKAQAMAADEVITRALRGHENCHTLIANVDTRYGGIYKAVIDSGLIAPADLHYYKDAAHAV